jgi:hypothetical protein
MHNNVALVRGGKNYFDLLEHIIHTTKHILHRKYIFLMKMKRANALFKAAKRGVEIFIVLDGFYFKKQHG